MTDYKAQSGAGSVESGQLRAVRRWGLVVMLCGVVLAVCGSLTPFNFQLDDGTSLRTWLSDFPTTLSVRTGRVDFFSNICLFIPIGLGGIAWLTRSDRLVPAVVRTIAVAVFAFLLSLFIEGGQTMLPDRVASWFDVAAQVIGTAFGICCWFVLAAPIRRWVARLQSAAGGGQRFELMLQAYFVFQFCMAVFPLDLSIHPVDIFQKFQRGRINLIPFVGHNWTPELIAEMLFFSFTSIPYGALATRLWMPRGSLPPVSSHPFSPGGGEGARRAAAPSPSPLPAEAVRRSLVTIATTDVDSLHPPAAAGGSDATASGEGPLSGPSGRLSPRGRVKENEITRSLKSCTTSARERELNCEVTNGSLLRSIPNSLAVGLTLVVGIEICQLLVLSRFTDATQVIMGGLGVLVGVLLMHALWPQHNTAGQQRRPWALMPGTWICLAMLYVLIPAGFTLWPWEFVFDGPTVRNELRNMLDMPFARLLRNSELSIHTILIRDVLLYLPLGLLLGAAVRCTRHRWRLLLAVTGAGSIVAVVAALEVLQTAVPQRQADLTSVLLSSASAVAGMAMLVYGGSRGRLDPNGTVPSRVH